MGVESSLTGRKGSAEDFFGIGDVFGDFFRLEEGGDHGDALGAVFDEGLEVFEFNAADAEGGEMDGLVDPLEVFDPDGDVVGFGGSGEDGAEADVIGAFGDGIEGLALGVGGFSYDDFGTENAACFADGHVFLAEVEAFGFDGLSDIEVVIDDEGDLGFPREGMDFLGEGDEVFGVLTLAAELEDIDAAVEQLLGDIESILGFDISEVENAVEFRPVELGENWV
jgi:hypothetical protein